MNNISNVMSSNPELDALSIKNKQPEKPNDLDKNAFLKLMIAQLNNQDPLEPQKNEDFVAQLAQFSSVEGIDNMNQSLESMASSYKSSQALQASSLVGRKVAVPATGSTYSGIGDFNAFAVLPTSTRNLQVNILDGAGTIVRQLDGFEGLNQSGNLDISWDGKVKGKNEAGEEAWIAAEPGYYQIEAIAIIDDKQLQLTTEMEVNVDSVTIDSNSQVTLNLEGVGPVSIDAVKQIL